jgi:hypothetical protein
VRPAEYTPAVLRIEDGSCTQGELELFSLTGGLLCLPKLLDRGVRAKLMFLTPTGPVLGEAELLKPVSWTEQPFRFLGLQENDQRRLRAATHAPEGPQNVEAQPTAEEETPPPALEFASFEPAPFDHEQSWIQKYRAALDRPERPKRRFPRLFLAALTAATLGLGVLYAFQMHLLR